MTAAYVLTTAAEADLREIIRYTRKQWGDDQTRSYVAKLTRGIERVAAGQGASKDMGVNLSRLADDPSRASLHLLPTSR